MAAFKNLSVEFGVVVPMRCGSKRLQRLQASQAEVPATSRERSKRRCQPLRESGLTPAAAGKRNGIAEKPREMPGNVGERRARLKLLRTQLEQLIKQHGGPGKSEEFPRS